MRKTLEQRVSELEKQLQEIIENKSVHIRKNLGVGDTFELAGLTWTILDITDKGYMCLANNLAENAIFDSDCNDWRGSELREYLNDIVLEKLSDAVGEDNIIPFQRDLLSLDGQNEYGYCEDKVSLLTVDEYRKYRGLIPNTDDYWWWLITPWGTPVNGYKTSVAVVSPSGYIFSSGCNNNVSVRAVCILKSISLYQKESKYAV